MHLTSPRCLGVAFEGLWVPSVGIGCPNLGIAQPDPLTKIDYDVLIRFSSSYKLCIHVNTLLQSFHPVEKNLN
jgi:hypothetical protein